LNLPDPSSPDPNTPDPNLPNIPDPSLPNDPNNPNPPTNVPINLPQLAGNPTPIHLPPNTSTNPPTIKLPDSGPVPSSSFSSGGGPISLPTGVPPAVGSNRSSGSSNTTGTQAGNAPRVSGLPGESTAGANAAAKGGGMPPMYPPPMGGMGAGGRGGGVRPGTAEKAGGPEVGGLGGAPGKPVEEIGVPSGLRGRGAGAPTGRATRAPRRRKPAAPARSAADERGEVLDEHLWRVEPPAMSDE
jgi:hypothetical protein